MCRSPGLRVIVMPRDSETQMLCSKVTLEMLPQSDASIHLGAWMQEAH